MTFQNATLNSKFNNIKFILVGSEKDRIERVKKHPKRMSELHKVLVAMAEATAKFKAQDQELMKEHSDKFGIDVEETFSHKYETSGQEETTKTTKTSSSDSVDNLL